MTGREEDRVSKHNRERRAIWKAGLHKKQLGRKLSQKELESGLAWWRGNTGNLKGKRHDVLPDLR